MIEDKIPQRTPLSQFGEFALIDHLTKDFILNQNSSVLGVGDDAAVIKCSDENLVVSTDMLVEGVHFNLAYTPLKHLGYKAVVVNLSDIAAMNAIPTQITVSVAVSNRFPVEALEELYAGIQTACSYYKVDLVGGDTTSSTSGLIISVTVVGFSNSENIVYRSGAKPNDLLVVTGDIGGAYMGLQVLERENEVFKVNPNNQPDLSMYTYIVERQLKPEARTDIVDLLKKLEVKPTAMIDISDGLSSEIIHLCKKSKTGVDLFENKIPLDPQVISTCEEFNLDSTTIALSGGEDYELLMTIDQKDYDKIKGNPNLTVIGYMTEPAKGMHLVTRDDSKVELIAKGWKSF
jgi:thiamine-monophosphate kinase